MSVQNFFPQIWATGILKERDRLNVAVQNCNRNWEGEIKQKGDRVKILTVGDVTIKDYTRNIDIDDPEQMDDAATYLEITEQKYFHVAIDDVDKAQANQAIMSEAQRKAAVAIADTMDTFIFNKYGDAGSTVTVASLTSANVFSTFTQIIKAFQKNNVPNSMAKILEVSPDVAEKIILAKIVKDTDNTKTIEGGKLGSFLGFDIYVSNGVIASGNTSHCIARTKDAITFAEQITEIDAYRPQKRFADAVKGLYVYGAKVIRPKELIHLNLTVAAESSI